MRSTRVLHMIKVRHVVIFLLAILFMLLVLSHNSIEDPDDIHNLGRGLTPLPQDKYKDAVRYSKLPDQEDTIEKLKQVGVINSEMVNQERKRAYQDREEVITKIIQQDKAALDEDGDIEERKGLIENLYPRPAQEQNPQQKLVMNNMDMNNNLATGTQGGGPFNPKLIFGDTMQAAINKTLKGPRYNNMQKLAMSNLVHPNDTKKKMPFDKMNKDLDNPSKNLSLHYINQNVSHLVRYKKEEAVIWVTGHPRSGTTLMRAMLDAHPDIRCGEETHIIPRVLSSHAQMIKSDVHMGRLTEANIDAGVIMDALGAYVLTVIAKHGEAANRLCNKDPLTIATADLIRSILPNSKFLFMIRDGRAVVHSVISREVSIQGFDRSSYANGLRSWNGMMTRMLANCRDLGPDVCLPVYYEQLVLHPRFQMNKILTFLDIAWDDIVLHHEQTVGKKGGVSLSIKEFSTDQVEKPVNMMSLTSWVDHFPDDTKSRVREIAPLLESLGYDVDNYPPSYGEPDPEIIKNTRNVEKRRRLKKVNDSEPEQQLQQHRKLPIIQKQPNEPGNY